MSFPSQIIVNKDSQKLGCINLFNIFVINFYFEIWHWFIIVFLTMDPVYLLLWILHVYIFFLWFCTFTRFSYYILGAISLSACWCVSADHAKESYEWLDQILWQKQTQLFLLPALFPLMFFQVASCQHKSCFSYWKSPSKGIWLSMMIIQTSKSWAPQQWANPITVSVLGLPIAESLTWIMESYITC